MSGLQGYKYLSLVVLQNLKRWELGMETGYKGS